MKTSNTPPFATRRILSTARLSFPLASAIAALFAAQTIHAANIWDGGAGTGDWNTPSNWDNDSVPSANALLTFAGNSTGFTTNDTTADRQYNGFLFTNNGTGSNNSTFTLAGNRITLGGNIGTTAPTTNTTITDIISLDMILDGNRTITTNQGATYGQHDLISSGIISSSGNFSLTKAGNATLILSGDNTYTGSTTVRGGARQINGANSGNGAVIVAAGTTFGGSGSVIGGINVTGVLSPGDSAPSIESFRGGALSFGKTSTYAYQLQTLGLTGDLAHSTSTLTIATGAILSLTDISTSTVRSNGEKLTLIRYTGAGAWNGELFSYNSNILADGFEINLGANKWMLK
jgi:autotransporter-associated beta strand protein